MRKLDTTSTATAWGLRTAAVLSTTALMLGLAACSKADDRTVGQQLDSAVQKTERAATEAKNDAKDTMAAAESSMKNAGTELKDATKDTTAKVTNLVDDVTITASVSAGLAKDPDLSAIKINVDTKGGVVTLSGPAPSVSAKDRATSIAQNVKGVASVNNQLEVRAG